MSLPTYTQGTPVSPAVQEAYGLISQLNEKNLALAVEYVKQLLKQGNDTASSTQEQEELNKKKAAFAKLMEIREEIAGANMPPMDEIRAEAIEKKYGCS